jgi:hypothetical protein
MLGNAPTHQAYPHVKQVLIPHLNQFIPFPILQVIQKLLGFRF